MPLSKLNGIQSGVQPSSTPPLTSKQKRQIEREVRKEISRVGVRPPDSKELGVLQDAGKFGCSIGIFMFGPLINRPTATQLKERGTGGMLYLDTDSNTLYRWNGSSWA